MKARLRTVILRPLSTAAKAVWWVVCLPFVAFETLGSMLVPAPRDDAVPTDDILRDRDLQIKKMLHSPPPQG